jgi:hypothetical protein
MKDTAQTPPDPQRMRALEQANAVRLARAELKRRIAEGEVSAAEVILDCPKVAARWTVADLLVAQHRWGSTRSRKFLQRNAISETKPIGQLTARQRQLLADQLDRSASIRPRLTGAAGTVPALEETVELAQVELAETPSRERELVYA